MRRRRAYAGPAAKTIPACCAWIFPATPDSSRWSISTGTIGSISSTSAAWRCSSRTTPRAASAATSTNLSHVPQRNAECAMREPARGVPGESRRLVPPGPLRRARPVEKRRGRAHRQKSGAAGRRRGSRRIRGLKEHPRNDLRAARAARLSAVRPPRTAGRVRMHAAVPRRGPPAAVRAGTRRPQLHGEHFRLRSGKVPRRARAADARRRTSSSSTTRSVVGRRTGTPSPHACAAPAGGTIPA